MREVTSPRPLQPGPAASNPGASVLIQGRTKRRSLPAVPPASPASSPWVDISQRRSAASSSTSARPYKSTQWTKVIGQQTAPPT